MEKEVDVNESQIQMSHTESHLVNIFNQPNSNTYLRKTTQYLNVRSFSMFYFPFQFKTCVRI